MMKEMISYSVGRWMDGGTRGEAGRSVEVIDWHKEVMVILNEETETRKMRLLNFSFIKVLVALRPVATRVNV